MATIGGHFNKISTFNTENDRIFVRKNNLSHLITITNGTRHIHVQNLKEQRCEQSWSVKSGQEICCAAVFDSITGQYAALVNNKAIRLWDKDAKAIEKGKKITPRAAVHTLVAENGWEPVVVYRDVSLSWLHSSKHSLMELAGENTDILWTGTQVISDTLFVVVYQKQTLTVCRLQKDTTQAQKKQFNTESIHKSSDVPQSFCLRNCKTELQLITLWGDGQVVQTWLSGVSEGLSIPVQRLPHTGLHTAITSLSPTHLAVAGIKETPTGPDGFGMWDTKFGTLQCWQPLPETHDIKHQLNISSHHKMLVLRCGRGLYAFPYIATTSSLGAALGKFPQTEAIIGTKNEALKNVILQLTNADKLSIDTLRPLLSQFIKLAGEQPNDLLFVQHQVGELVSHCISEKRFWPRDELHALIKAKVLIQPSLCESLFQALVEHKELAVIHSALANIPDIPETAFVIALEYFLSCDDEAFAAVREQSMDTGDDSGTEEQDQDHPVCPFSLHKALFIDCVLRLPCNEIFLLECLRKTDFKHALALLQYLQYKLSVAAISTKQEDTSKSKKRPPTMLKVVDWMCVVLDAHFTQLVLSSDAHELLVHLHQTVELQVEFFHELVHLEGILSQLKEKSVLPQKANPGLYSIQTLHL